MRQYLLLLLLFLVPFLRAQDKVDVGISAGTSFYLGDINTSRLFYSPGISTSFIYEYNINTRYSMRVNLTYATLHASDLDFPDLYQQLRKASFSLQELELSNFWVFNFLPYKYAERKKSFTPYVFLGYSYAFVVSSTDNAPSHFSFPFGVGFKVKMSYRINLGLEWSMRKTFTDKIDGVQKLIATEDRTWTHNNDWYSFAGIIVTYKIFDNKGNCPAYEKK